MVYIHAESCVYYLLNTPVVDYSTIATINTPLSLFNAYEDTCFLLVTKEYSSQREKYTKWDDLEIGIKWPIKERVLRRE